MFTRAAEVETATVEAGFGLSRASLLGLRMRALADEMTVFYVIAAALLAAIVVPAWQASQPTPVVERVIETGRVAAKGDRLRSKEVDAACWNATYGNASAGCLVAIAKDSGRANVSEVRIIGFGEAHNG